MTLMTESDHPNSRHNEATLYACTAILCWSLGALLCCSLDSIPLLQLVSILQIIGAFAAMVWDSKRPNFTAFIRALPKRWRFISLLLCNQLCYVYAFRNAPAAQVDLINYTWPVMLLIGESWRRGDRLTWEQISGIFVCALGIIILFLPDLLKTAVSVDYLSGYFTAALAALSWTIYSILNKQSVEDSKTSGSIGQDMLVSGTLLALVNSFYGSWAIPSLTNSLLIGLYSVIGFGVAFPAWKYALKLGHYATISSLANTIPVLSILWLAVGGIIDFSYTLALSTLLVSAGCYLLKAPEAEKKTKTSCAQEELATA